MIVYLIKFIHVLFAMGLLGLTIYAVILATPTQQSKLPSLNKKLIVISIFAVITGTLLIYPKHYSFHTLWIQAAYLLIFIYGICLKLVAVLNRRTTYSWFLRIFYTILIFLLLLVIHDAVTKNTLLTKDLLTF